MRTADPWKDYEQIAQIGKGSYGRVFSARPWRGVQASLVAVKAVELEDDEAVEQLTAEVMREVWDCVCTDPMDQHMREAESLWAGCENTFMQELNECELELYQLFDGSMEYLRSPFRICRDLAFYNEGKTDTGKFFLGCRDLGTRLGINHKTASKYLLELVNYEIIKVVSAGRMIKRQASEYEWMLSS